MNEKAEDVLSFGDRAIDMIASKRAGIKAIACLSGTKERSMLLGTAYDRKQLKPSTGDSPIPTMKIAETFEHGIPSHQVPLDIHIPNGTFLNH